MKLNLKVFKNRVVIACLLGTLFMSGCGGQITPATNEETKQDMIADVSENPTDSIEETSTNGHVDFDSLIKMNDEIVAWLNVPGTGIDCAIVQGQDDSFYRSHNYKKEEDTIGCAFLDYPVVDDFCDFNTVIHGNGKEGIFENLINFANPEFFEENRQFYVYLPDNQLTYDVVAVFERENSSLIRQFSFAEAKGDREFIQYVINERIPGKLLCEGWEEFDEYNFFTTLSVDSPDNDKQLVVIGLLTNDAAGTIDREVIEEFELGPDLLAQ